MENPMRWCRHTVNLTGGPVGHIGFYDLDDPDNQVLVERGVLWPLDPIPEWDHPGDQGRGILSEIEKELDLPEGTHVELDTTPLLGDVDVTDNVFSE